MPFPQAFHFRHRLCGHGLRPQGRLLDLGLSLDTVGVHAGLCLSHSGTTRLHSTSFSLALQQLLLFRLRSDLILQLLPHQLASILLVHAIAIIPRSHLLRLCSNLNSLLHRLEQRVGSFRVRRLDALHVNSRNHKIVSWKSKLSGHFARLRSPKHGRLNDVSTVLVELVKSCCRNAGTDPRCNSHAHVAHKISDSEELGSFRFVGYIEVPVVSQLDREPCMILGFDQQNVTAQLRTQLQSDVAEGILLLWFASREAQDCKIFIRAQHDHVGPKHNATLLSFVVEHLHSCVVRGLDSHYERAINTRSTEQQLLRLKRQLFFP
mmetsp:Transcript_38055/g.91300  ORF Transcript_38055/g.91300 Transcript_38055/m.91300 type:complete len:321 (+) Transcript_38055:472-1434(+)